MNVSFRSEEWDARRRHRTRVDAGRAPRSDEMPQLLRSAVSLLTLFLASTRAFQPPICMPRRASALALSPCAEKFDSGDTAFIHVQHSGRHGRVLMMEQTELLAVLDEVLPLPEEERKSKIVSMVSSWEASERQRLSKEMSDLLSQRAVAVQTEALQRYAKGEDVTAASNTLQTIVDMTVQVQLLVKTIEEGDAS